MNSFIGTLHSIDNSILLFINGKNTPLMDDVMFFISGRFTWIPFYLLLVILIWRKYKNASWLIILFAGIAIVLSDQVSNLIKNEVMRLRPSHTPGIMDLLHYHKDSAGESYMGGLYGFVSNHAANSASLSVYLIFLLRNRYVTGGLILWTFFLCYSRIYLGVHFPSDVFGGLVVGLITGFSSYKAYTLLKKMLALKY